MIELTLAEVAAATGGAVSDRHRGDVVHVVATDSRKVEPGALFVALRGEHGDGHDHIAAAHGAGAVGYLTERAPVAAVPGAVEVDDTWAAIARLGAAVRDRVDPIVVAITGSVGKTTTKDLTAAAVRGQRRVVAAQGSFNNELGVPLTLLDITTGTEIAIVEIGARGRGHIARLTPHVRPVVGVVTAVAEAHTALFGDLEAVARAKAELVEAVAADGAAVLNHDDDRVRAMGALTRGEVVSYGRSSGADVRAEDVTLDGDARARFRVRSPWGEADVHVPIPGVQHVGNALAALAVAGWLGLDLAAAAHDLATATVSRWRSDLQRRGGVTVLNDAYNANPASTRAALATVAELRDRGGGRAVAVLGQMAELGSDGRGAHVDVGRLVAMLGYARLIVVAGGDADAYLDGAGTALESTLVDDADEALQLLEADIRPGDVVLTKGSRVAGLEVVAEGLLALLGGRDA